MPNCCLCYNLGPQGSTKLWDKPLVESTNFVAIPSLGALVPGWVMVVPKEHYLSIGALTDSMVGEMAGLKDALVSRLTQSYGELCAFEHGPGAAKRDVGCGVDHAHLHIVPVQFDLAEAAKSFLPPDLVWKDAHMSDCRRAFAAGLDYLYLEQPLGTGRIAVGGHFGSQVFRRAIATRLGSPHEYNWREYPQTDNILSTVETLLKVQTQKLIGQVEVESLA